jgi:Flp pilus assembly protein TadG
MKRHLRGSEIVEFALVLMPMLAALTVVIDIGWAVFAKSTLQRAVRVGVTAGTTLTASQITQGCLTAAIKSKVQQNASGILSGTAGLNSIKVRYFLPPLPDSTGPATDVSSQADGNTPGNIIQVSVENFVFQPLLPRIISLQKGSSKSPLALYAYSAGLIQPTQDRPCIGAAP